MKSLKPFLATALLIFLMGMLKLPAQGTAFTYQGQLNDNGSPANGVYDLSFSLYDNVTNGNPVGVSNIIQDLSITNGLFTVTIDPGTNVFNGNPRWLQLGVRPGASAGNFTNLTARLLITPVPTAIFAASAASVSTNASLTNVTASGTFTGNAGGLTNLSGGAIQTSSISSNSIAPGQVVKNLNGLTDSVILDYGNNIFFTTNGNIITILTSPGLLSWIPVSSTTQAAAVNKGYLLTNDSLVTVTLPSAPAMADIIRVSGSGTNGWKIAQNASQFIRIKNLPGNIGVNWTARDSGRAWTNIACSADGTKLVAAVYGGQIYTSTNSGATWTARDSNRNWSSVASSADGNKLIAVVYGGYPYTSTNAGVTWVARTGAGIQNWISVASSANGNILNAVPSGSVNYVSSDSGVTWTASTTSVGGHLACSADGLNVVVAINGGQIYTSPDSGITWIARFGSAAWSAVASSADGINLVATVNGGQIYTSTDSGVTWTARDSNRAWNGVASSADGTKLLATVYGGQLYASSDSGVTWFPRASSLNWDSVTSSADGTHLAATVNGGQIYTSDNANPTTTAGATGYLLGEPNSAVELQYIGNNQFLPLSHEGFIGGF